MMRYILSMDKEQYEALCILMVSGRHGITERMKFDIEHGLVEHASKMLKVQLFGEAYALMIERVEE